MAIFEQDKVLYEEASNGDKTIIMPVTRANNVEGLGRSANTKFVAGEVVYVDNNKKIALKCIAGGTTGTGELDVSSKAIGDTVTDGSVTWQVCNRTSDVTSVNGQTGDVEIKDYVQSASIDGTTIVLTKADGTEVFLPIEIPQGGSTVSITAGTVANNGTIPLPSGYTRAQCKYAVWCHSITHNDGNKGLRVQVNQSTGVVTVGMYLIDAESNMYWSGGTAGYLCIAVK